MCDPPKDVKSQIPIKEESSSEEIENKSTVWLNKFEETAVKSEPAELTESIVNQEPKNDIPIIRKNKVKERLPSSSFTDDDNKKQLLQNNSKDNVQIGTNEDTGCSAETVECSFSCDVSDISWEQTNITLNGSIDHLKESIGFLDNTRVVTELSEIDDYYNYGNFDDVEKTAVDKLKQKHNCDTCKKQFNHLSQLKRHTLMHTGEKPYQCDVCNKSFGLLYHLKNHKVMHTGEKPHQCETCNKFFTKLSNLKRHKLLHTGEKPHQCEVCNKCFLNLNHLKTHKLLHTGEKPHQCDVCKKSFNVLGNLTRHKSIHSGLKPHRCEVCNKRFAQLSSLKSHKLLHTGEKPYQCDVCHKSYNILNNLKKHKKDICANSK